MIRKSTGEYPPNWKEIATAVKDAVGWKCVRCNHVHDIDAGYMLTVHHLDMNCSNCAWWNIPALCQRCHLSIQGRVVMERFYMLPHSEWFKPYLAGYYAVKLGLIAKCGYTESLKLLPPEVARLEFDGLLETINGNMTIQERIDWFYKRKVYA